jgi:PKD repeat protein
MKTAFRRSLVALAAAAVATLSMSFVSPAQAATPTIDVQQLVFTTTQSPAVMAQTFTAGTSAELVRVSIPFYTGFAHISLGIQGVTADGKPDGTYKTQMSWSGAQSCCRSFYDFNLTTPIAVTKGTQYAIVVRRLSPGAFNWYFSSFAPPSFTGGKLFVSTCDTAGCAWYTGPGWGADFGFKTWVSSGVNQAPTVAADNASISVAEGTAPANTGTYSDPDGDAVTLTASSGALTKTGTSSGTWSWTAPAPDEASMQPVTVTADDGQGQTATSSFNLTVTGVAPTAQILTDPISAPEGTALPFTGGATSPDPADNASGFTYGWTVTKDGNAFAQATGAAFSFAPDDEGTYVVTFHATDDGGLTGTSSMTVIGTNVAPTATISGVTASAPLVVTPQETLTFGGGFTDPGRLDTHTTTWSFGDGSVSTASYGPGGSASLSAAHSYTAAGTYTVTLTVSDDDGGVGQASTRVTVQTAQQALASIAAYVQGLTSLNAGQRNSLEVKLSNAADSVARGNSTAATNQLNAFLNEVSADQNAGKLTLPQATMLRNAVHQVQGALGTYNRFLEWWPLEA